jgi:hypothetical protein
MRRTMTKLLPCPFCGEDEGQFAPKVQRREGLRKGQQHWLWFFVLCERCSVRTTDFATEARAMEHWNMRTAPIVDWCW